MTIGAGYGDALLAAQARRARLVRDRAGPSPPHTLEPRARPRLRRALHRAIGALHEATAPLQHQLAALARRKAPSLAAESRRS